MTAKKMRNGSHVLIRPWKLETQKLKQLEGNFNLREEFVTYFTNFP